MPFTIHETSDYHLWFARLREERARARINARIRRLSLGKFGDVKALGGGVSEIRIDYGPGYRVYYTMRGAALVLLLTGGDKSRQRADIVRARELAAAWEPDDGH